MRTTPTDRGIAFIRPRSDGTSDVYVATGVSPTGEPEDVFAIHFNRRVVSIADQVDIRAANRPMSRTSGPVHVFADETGAVHLIGPRTK